MRKAFVPSIVIAMLAGGLGCASAPEAQPVTAPQEAKPAPPRKPAYIAGPRISKSRGTPGGVVLLWPRINPSARTDEMRPMAMTLRDRLEAMIRTNYPDRPIDIRPEPERVCPQDGCLAPAIGVLLMRVEDGCVAVVQASPAGTSPAKQMTWAGDLETHVEVPFRKPPESYMRVYDFIPCADMLERAKRRDGDVLKALKQVL